MYHSARPGCHSPSPALYSSSGPDITRLRRLISTTRPHTSTARLAGFLPEKYISRNFREIFLWPDCCIRSSMSFSCWSWKCLWFEKRPTVPLRCKLWVNWNCSAMSVFGLQTSEELFNVDVGDVGPHRLQLSSEIWDRGSAQLYQGDCNLLADWWQIKTEGYTLQSFPEFKDCQSLEV